jgi:hypothetical protein
MSLRFPVFLIGSVDGVVVVKTDEGECIMLFHSKQLAEDQIQKIGRSHPQLGILYALEVTSAELLADGLRELPADVTCAVWDATAGIGGFTHVSVEELLRSAGGR